MGILGKWSVRESLRAARARGNRRGAIARTSPQLVGNMPHPRRRQRRARVESKPAQEQRECEPP